MKNSVDPARAVPVEKASSVSVRDRTFRIDSVHRAWSGLAHGLRRIAAAYVAAQQAQQAADEPAPGLEIEVLSGRLL